MSSVNRDIAELIGNFITFCTIVFFLSGFQICYKLYKNGALGYKISSFPIVSTITK